MIDSHCHLAGPEFESDLEGLLHISELADHKVENPQDVVKPGEEVDVKILRVDTDERKIGQPIGYTDLFIAAHALALDVTLVTDNVREFGRVRGLRVENWQEPAP